MTVLTCPESRVLVEFSLGLTDDAATDNVEEHLRTCRECVMRLQSLAAQDTLTDAVHAQTLIVEKPRVTERVRALMEHAKQLYPSLPRAASADALVALLPAAVDGADLGRLGPYRIRRILGAGAMGVVFEAFDLRLQRPAALKALRPHLSADAEARARFVREAQAAAALHHDNLVTIYDVGEEAGLPYLTMELLSGETLEARLQREGPLPVSDIVAIGRQAAAGLAAAHERGLVHRDIKPANIWIEARNQESGVRGQESEPSGLSTPDYRVKILDFGLARAVAELTNLTSPGTVVGTPTYMAPEQADGAAVDARSDLFSLGSVLYALAAGAPPFAADSTLGVLRAVCDKAPRPLRELNPAIPQWLADVIAKLHAKNPNDRFQTAAEVADALTRQESQRMPPARRSRRGWRVACAVAASLVLACIGLGLAEATGMTQWRSLLSRSAAAPPPVDGDPAAPLPLAAIAAQDEKKDDKKDDKKPAVVAAALFPFEERGAGVKDLGAKVTDLLFAKLAARPELFLVDRADLKKTLAEQELNLSGAVRADQATKVGQLTGAKLLVSGSVFQVDKKTHVVARVIGTETSRMTAAAVEGKSSDELGPLVDQLADKLAETIAKQTDVLVAKPVLAKDRIAAVKQQLKQAARPSVWVRVTERHVGAAVPDPAAQTEILRFCKETGFEIIDVEEGSKGKADVFITGEGISETAARTGGLISVRARVELKAVDRTSGKVLAADRQTVVVVDLAEQIAGKSALEEAAAILAERILPQLAKR